MSKYQWVRDDFMISDTIVTLHRQVTELTDNEIYELKKFIYHNGIVVLKEQGASASEFVNFGLRIGELVPYYEEMYHHPEHKEIFISSNCQADGKPIGVPKTGSFWHSDYAFMQRPFAFTIIYPQVISTEGRGTYFIDMAKVYKNFTPDLKGQLVGAIGTHSVRRYFKIRPNDVYRPIGEILTEIEKNTPEVKHPAVIRHPVTGDLILYINRGFTESLTLKNSRVYSEQLLHHLFFESAQTDKSFSHPNIQLLIINKGDIVIWDNRRFIHHAKHDGKSKPNCTFRLTAYDAFPFNA